MARKPHLTEMLRFKTINIVRTIICLLLLFVIGISLFLLGKVTIGISTIICSALIRIMIFIMLEDKIKKSYKSNKILQGATILFSLYEDHLEVRSENGTGNIKYKDLFKLFETDKCFYIMTSNRIFL